MTSNPQYYKSLSLKLTEIGSNQSITLPDRVDIQHGQLILKSYCVQFDSNNTTNQEINVNLHGVSQMSNVNNSQSFISLPVSRNGDKTTLQYSDIVCYVQGHRLHQTLQYDLLDDGGSGGDPPDVFFNGNVPSAVYMNFQYLSPGI